MQRQYTLNQMFMPRGYINFNAIHSPKVKTNAIIDETLNHFIQNWQNSNKNQIISKRILNHRIFTDNESRIAFQLQLDHFFNYIKEHKAKPYKKLKIKLENFIYKLNNPDINHEEKLVEINKFQKTLKPISDTNKVLKKIGICILIAASVAIVCAGIGLAIAFAASTLMIPAIVGIALIALTGLIKGVQEMISNSSIFSPADKRKIEFGLFRNNGLYKKNTVTGFFDQAKKAVMNSEEFFYNPRLAS